jgi:hypothetical protein
MRPPRCGGGEAIISAGEHVGSGGRTPGRTLLAMYAGHRPAAVAVGRGGAADGPETVGRLLAAGVQLPDGRQKD